MPVTTRRATLDDLDALAPLFADPRGGGRRWYGGGDALTSGTAAAPPREAVPAVISQRPPDDPGLPDDDVDAAPRRSFGEG